MLLDWKNLLKYRRFTTIFSALIIFISIAGIAMRGGLLYGIDFTGGLQILLEFNRPVDSNQMSQIRSVFGDDVSGVRINTVSIQGEQKRRGLMITVRGSDIVNKFTARLFQAGQRGNQDVFSQAGGGESILDSSVLTDNFSFTSSSGKINLSTATRTEIRDRVQSIVNEQLIDQVVTDLRRKLGHETDKLDLNWANVNDIQSWIIDRQLNAFIDSVRELRSDASINEWASTNPLLERFSVPADQFKSIFSLSDDETERINLNTVDVSGLREILRDEFFGNRYEPVARAVIQKRDKLGIFRTREQVFSMDEFKPLHVPPLRASATISPFVTKQSEMISPAIGADLISYAALSIMISFIGILAYLYIRFEFTYSLGAISAIIHDVFITVGLLTILKYEFTVPVIAAILTVIGYSLNDTIVNYDRVRENRVLMGYKSEWLTVINRSVFEVLNRTFVTSITTFVAAFILYWFGGIALRAFSITLIIGVVAGTYSSIFVSNVVLFKLQEAVDI